VFPILLAEVSQLNLHTYTVSFNSLDFGNCDSIKRAKLTIVHAQWGRIHIFLTVRPKGALFLVITTQVDLAADTH
jgi:hypothetical protein